MAPIREKRTSLTPDTSAVRGPDREATFPRGRYFDDAYFAPRQVCSQAMQIHYINRMRPTSILEVGPGNGFTATFMRLAGVPVTTADINPNLKPDVCGPIGALPELLRGQRFDLAVCCEVLEHMPLEQLDGNLQVLRSVADRLFLTLPAYMPRAIGIGGFFRSPRGPTSLFDLTFRIPRWRKPTQADIWETHFWEVGFSRECSRKAVVERLRPLYRSVTTGRFAINPGHLYFVCE
jgi:hypothetical protein